MLACPALPCRVHSLGQAAGGSAVRSWLHASNTFPKKTAAPDSTPLSLRAAMPLRSHQELGLDLGTLTPPHRLDAGTEGVVVLSRSADLTRAFRQLMDGSWEGPPKPNARARARARQLQGQQQQLLQGQQRGQAGQLLAGRAGGWSRAGGGGDGAGAAGEPTAGGGARTAPAAGGVGSGGTQNGPVAAPSSVGSRPGALSASGAAAEGPASGAEYGGPAPVGASQGDSGSIPAPGSGSGAVSGHRGDTAGHLPNGGGSSSGAAADHDGPSSGDSGGGEASRSVSDTAAALPQRACSRLPPGGEGHQQPQEKQQQARGIAKRYRCATATAPPVGRLLHHVLEDQRLPGEMAHTVVVVPGTTGALRCELVVEQVSDAAAAGVQV